MVDQKVNIIFIKTKIGRIRILCISFLLLLINSCELLDDIVPNTDNTIDRIEGTWLCKESSSIFGNSSFYVDISRSETDGRNWDKIKGNEQKKSVQHLQK